jgi:hypothetical protein
MMLYHGKMCSRRKYGTVWDTLFLCRKKNSCEVDDKHYQYYRYFLYFPFDVLNQYISYHVSAEMIPIIANR